MMSSDAIHHCDDFGQLNLLLTTVYFSVVQLSYYRQIKFENFKTVNIPNVTLSILSPARLHGSVTIFFSFVH